MRAIPDVSSRSLTGLTVGLMLAGTSFAQGLSDSVTSLNATGTVFSALTHTKIDGRDSNTEPSIGVSGTVGGDLRSGANTLQLQYGALIETSRELPTGDQTENSSVRGASQFQHYDPGSTFDFNVGHTVESVRNDTGFLVDPTDYDTRNEVTAGGGLRFYLGALSYARFSVQAGQSFGSRTLNDDKSATAAAELVRRLDERSDGMIRASRTWSEDTLYDLVIDTAQLIYERRLEYGTLRMGAGKSRADTEFPSGFEDSTDAVTGFFERTWTDAESFTSVLYERELTDSATDLSTGGTPSFEFLQETVRTRNLVVSDSIEVVHNTRRLCDICTFELGLGAALLDSQLIALTTHEYRASVSLGLQVTGLERLTADYSWQADAGEDGDVIVEQLHEFTFGWNRLLAENTTFGIEVSHSFLNSRLDRPDEDQTVLRLNLTHGFALADIR